VATKKKTKAKKAGTAKKKVAARRAVKKATQKPAKKKAAAKAPKRARKARKPYKPVGSPKTRQTVRQMGKRILDAVANNTAVEGAKSLGIDTHDVNNLRAGNLPSLDIVIKLISNGRYSPESIIFGKNLQKLPPKFQTKACKKQLISNRIRKLSQSKPAQQWSKATGLSAQSIYQLRVSGSRAGLHTVLGFINAGVSMSDIFFGK
jgi:hypothetical protein